MTSPAVWAQAARPRTLPAAIAPVLVGTAAASGFIAWRFAAALVVALAMQVGVNFANDLFDAAAGVDSASRTGPVRATATGLVEPRHMKIAMIAAFAVAGVAGAGLAVAVGPELFVVGAVCIVAAVGYSGGRRPYASRGLGEIFVFVFFGLVATVGSQYVQDEVVSPLAYTAAIPVGLLAAAILVVNNLRDIPTDAAAGKLTLAVRLGERRTRRLHQALVGVAFIYTLVVAIVARSFMPLLALVAVPVAVRPVSLVLRSSEPHELIDALAGTARTELVYGALLAVGLWTS